MACGTELEADAQPIAIALAGGPDNGLAASIAQFGDGPDLPPGSRRTRTIIVALLVFGFAFLAYYLAPTIVISVANLKYKWTEPIHWLDFYVYLADAMNHGTLNLDGTGAPLDHPDLVIQPDGDVYLPYQPAPAVLLMPFVAIWGTGIDQWLFSMIVGAANVALFWYILRLMGMSRTTKLLLIPFFAFGTANFYSATTGTLWFYNHVVSVMFLELAIIFMSRRSTPILTALSLGGAFMSRQPTILAAPFFIYWMAAQRHPDRFGLADAMGALTLLVRLQFSSAWETVRDGLGPIVRDKRVIGQIALFCAVLVPFGVLSLWYNAARFGGIFDTGLDEIYAKYGNCCYSIYQSFETTRFKEFDLRNLPLHLYTIFLLPPTFQPPIGAQMFQNSTGIRPSEFGMSAILTSPPFIFAFLAMRKDALKTASWLVIPLVALPTLMYYSQGWVQFGYRYLMDYLPFLMILTAFGFEAYTSRRSFWIKLSLVALAVVVGFWGRYWGTRLGW